MATVKHKRIFEIANFICFLSYRIFFKYLLFTILNFIFEKGYIDVLNGWQTYVVQIHFKYVKENTKRKDLVLVSLLGTFMNVTKIKVEQLNVL